MQRDNYVNFALLYELFFVGNGHLSDLWMIMFVKWDPHHPVGSTSFSFFFPCPPLNSEAFPTSSSPYPTLSPLQFTEKVSYFIYSIQIQSHTGIDTGHTNTGIARRKPTG